MNAVIGKYLKGANALWPLYFILAVLLCLRNYLLPHDTFDGGYTHYNNFVIFKQSFFHLIQGKNLYVHYPTEHFDLFKYTPTFALAFGSIAWLPDWLGLALWNLLNVWVLVAAIRKLPGLSQGMQLALGLLLIQETVTSTMNSQSNVLIAGLLVLAWSSLENGFRNRAIFFIACTVFIKIFGILFFAMLLFYPKWYKMILPVLIIMGALILLPLPITGLDGLARQYQQFGLLLQNDSNTFVKYSVMGWMQSWFNLAPSKNAVVAVGFVLQFLPLLVYGFYKKQLQNMPDLQLKLSALFAATLLIWMVIFNHMAESATFVIAVTGVLVWFFYSGLPKGIKIGLLIPVIVFTCFGPSDIFPKELRHKIVEDWQLKVFPCILVWAAGIVEFGKNVFPKRVKNN